MTQEEITKAAEEKFIERYSQLRETHGMEDALKILFRESQAIEGNMRGVSAEIKPTRLNVFYYCKCKEPFSGFEFKAALGINQRAEWQHDNTFEIIAWLNETHSPIQEQITRDGWISVEEKLPDDSFGRVLVYVREVNDLGISNFVWNCSYSPHHGFTDKCEPYSGVTHWMPLPAAPAHQKK